MNIEDSGTNSVLLVEIWNWNFLGTYLLSFIFDENSIDSIYTVQTHAFFITVSKVSCSVVSKRSMGDKVTHQKKTILDKHVDSGPKVNNFWPEKLQEGDITRHQKCVICVEFSGKTAKDRQSEYSQRRVQILACPFVHLHLSIARRQYVTYQPHWFLK